MNQRKVKALKRALSDDDGSGKKWYESYVRKCTASSVTPFGTKRIKRMAKGKPMKEMRNGKFLEFVEEKTWG